MSAVELVSLSSINVEVVLASYDVNTEYCSCSGIKDLHQESLSLNSRPTVDSCSSSHRIYHGFFCAVRSFEGLACLSYSSRTK